MGSKHEPSWRWRKERPAFESRRVRTQPSTVTGAPTSTRPARTSRIVSFVMAPPGTIPRARLGSSGTSLWVYLLESQGFDPDVAELHQAGRAGVPAVAIAPVVLEADRAARGDARELGMLDDGLAV